MNALAHGHRMTFALVVLGAIFALLGCGGRNTLDVSGTVTFDGVLVERGEISFIPIEGGAPDGGVIEQGKFAFSAKPGNKRVEIRASRPVPAARQNNPEMGLMYEDYIPVQYNRETKLLATVSADAERVYQFSMTSQP